MLRIIYPLLQLLFVEKKKIRYGPKKNFEYKSQRKSLDPEEKSLDPEEKVRILKKKYGSGRKSSDPEEKVWISKKKFRSQSEIKSLNTYPGKKVRIWQKDLDPLDPVPPNYIEV